MQLEHCYWSRWKYQIHWPGHSSPNQRSYEAACVFTRYYMYKYFASWLRRHVYVIKKLPAANRYVKPNPLILLSCSNVSFCHLIGGLTIIDDVMFWVEPEINHVMMRNMTSRETSRLPGQSFVRPTSVHAYSSALPPGILCILCDVNGSLVRS